MSTWTWNGEGVDNPYAVNIRPQGVVARTLNDLVNHFALTWLSRSKNPTITGLAITTGQIIPGDLYFAVRGKHTHGAKYAREAIERGAVAILTDGEGSELAGDLDVPVLICDQPRDLVGRISAWFYSTSPESPRLIGITGTNGKTSTTYFTEDIIRQLGLSTGISSTTECHINGVSFESRLTTPEACEMHALVARMSESEVDFGIIEVSAQAVTHGRVDGLYFQAVGFTSFSQDHLDDYVDMESYFQAKKAFFTEHFAKSSVVSIDCEWGERLARETEIAVTTISSDEQRHADWTVTVISEQSDGSVIMLRSPKGETLETSVRIPSTHMAANAGLAIALLVSAGIDFAEIKRTLESGPGITAVPPGRMELISNGNGPCLFVDAAHTPDAIFHTLEAIRRVTKGKLVALVGAGGDRDKSKRFAMGAATGSLCDFVIVTDDNSRTENPSDIRKAVLEGVLSVLDAVHTAELGDNAEAITHAIDLSGPNDTIVWLGPGSENYRDVGGVKTPFSARQLARQALENAGY